MSQALFYVFREIAFDKLVTKVERAEGQIRLFEGLYQDEVLVPFPNSLISDANEKKAVLSYLSCSDTCGYMDVLLKTMLGGKLPLFSSHRMIESDRKLTVQRNLEQIYRNKLQAKSPTSPEAQDDRCVEGGH